MSVPAIPLSARERLDLLAKLESLRFVPPLSLRQFLDDARAYGISVTSEVLERFEQLDLFRPLFHATYPRTRHKAEHVDGGVRVLEELKRGEKWDGPVHLETVYPAFQYHPLEDWIAARRITPSTGQSRKPWRRYTAGGEDRGSPFFSIFQLFTLDHRLASSTLLDNLVWYLDRDPNDPKVARRLLRSRTKAARIMLGSSSTAANPRFDTAFLCQAIASRYFFETQGDARTITVADSGPPQRSWHQYRRSWDAKRVAEQLGITAETVQAHHEIAHFAAEATDPLLDWYDLLRFVSVEKKRKLKGEARLGQLLHSMEEMLRLFHRDMAGTVLHSPLRRFALRDSQGNVENPAEAPNALRLVSNSYHVNPQPKLYLFVEGDGEQDSFPALIQRLWGFTAQSQGIEIRNLQGVQGFEGGPSDQRSTLLRLIDELHHLQVLTFVLLDNEGKRTGSLVRLRDRLAATRSMLHPERTVTRRELVFVWRTCFEFENFSDEEIAHGLNVLSHGRAMFNPADVSALRNQHGQRQSTSLGGFFERKTGFSLPKKKLLKQLVQAATDEGADAPKRPIVKVVRELLHLAALNHQPTLNRIGARNQHSGFLGYPHEGPPTAEVDNLFRGLRRLAGEFGIPVEPAEGVKARKQ